MNMRRSIWILGDQLAEGHSALALADKSRDVVFMAESRKNCSRLRFHKIKLAMGFSAMRHFAKTLRESGWDVDYHSMADSPDYFAALSRHLGKFKPEGLLVMEPNSFFEREAVQKIAKRALVPLVFTPPVQFLGARGDFIAWASGKKRLLMESHYRLMRERLGILIDADGTPEGGRWNLDSENRKTVADWLKEGSPQPPPPPGHSHDEITREVIDQVEHWFSNAPGRAAELRFPVTRSQAIEELRDFVAHRLGKFGAYEDLMLSGQPRLFHSALSAPINLGLLSPLECVEAAVTAYRTGRVPLNSTEGFVRQIIGWREFINGVYWLKMPDYAASNALRAERSLPDFFYTADTEMRCLRETLSEVLGSAYNHHIQRLMILGNFMLLAGINPQEGLRWFSEMYADAFDWVMAANVLGMSLHADGGFMATKPYAASAFLSKL